MNEHWISSNNGEIEREKERVAKWWKKAKWTGRWFDRSIIRSVGWPIEWSISLKNDTQIETESKWNGTRNDSEKNTLEKEMEKRQMPKLVSTNYLIGITEWITNHIRMRDKSLNAMFNCTLTSSKVVANSTCRWHPTRCSRLLLFRLTNHKFGILLWVCFPLLAKNVFHFYFNWKHFME